MLRLTVNTKEEAYWLHDRLYEQAERIFLVENPCNFIGGRCFMNRGHKDYDTIAKGSGWFDTTENGCCGQCRYNKKGCTIRDLPCKLSLCGTAKEQMSEKSQKKLSALKRILENSNIPSSLGNKMDGDKRVSFAINGK